MVESHPGGPARCLVDGPCSGSWNMACDEVLLSAAIEQRVISVRTYRWEQPTVTLGHFQSAEDPVLASRFADLSWVRRLSGGGAILHHHEVTYSCAIPSCHPLAAAPTEIYGAVHTAIIQLLADAGVSAQLRGAARSGPDPFLCFGRGDPRDIVIGRHKIVGSAQRRRSGAILQHGALLLRQSPHAPEFPGIFDLTGVRFEETSLARALCARITDRLAGDGDQIADAGTLTERELRQVRDWSESRYPDLRIGMVSQVDHQTAVNSAGRSDASGNTTTR